MNDLGIFGWVAGGLQILVACYALRLNRLFSASRVGWTLFGGFALLALLRLFEAATTASPDAEATVKVTVIYALVSLLLLTGMVHLETILKERRRVELHEQRLRTELEAQVRQQTAHLTHAIEELEAEIQQRQRMEAEVERTHRQLLTASRQAGMAEMATAVLHNVGNVLNSVNVSASLVADQVKHSKMANLTRLAALVRDHTADLAHFLAHDPKGQRLPLYLIQLGDHMAGEQAALAAEMLALKKNVEHIRDIVTLQQNYARVAGLIETVPVTDLVEDALRMNSGALARHDVQLHRDFDPQAPLIAVEKPKVLQILINLIRNAKYACDESGRKDKQIWVRVINGEGTVQIAVADNGVGISPEAMTRLFTYGFSTRKHGHGFGLCGSAQIARDLGGALRAQSDGPGTGATFTLELPVRQTQRPTPAEERPEDGWPAPEFANDVPGELVLA